LDKNKVLYKKKKDVTISLTPENKLLLTASHEDFRHEMELEIEFSQPGLIIEDVRTKMKLYPHEECAEARDSLRPMIGKQVKPGIMKTVKRLVGNRGCTHLTNLFQEACYSVIQGQGIARRHELARMVPGLSIEQTSKILLTLRPELVDSCYSYIRGANFHRAAEQAVLPDDPGIEAFIKKNRI
jgi:Protein of unknown function (DUF2889)